MTALAVASFLLAPQAQAQVPASPGAWASFDWFEYSGRDPHDAAGRPGQGEYANPVLQGFYPDPSVTRVGDEFYLVNSTFAWFPGIPVWHSRDLVHWTQIGNAIDRSSQLDFKKLGLSRGVFAPAISHKDGVFYILNTCVDCGGNFVITARDPAGPWSDPVWLPDLEGGIDPSLFFDADGRTWIVNNGPPEGTPLYQGHRAIWIQEFDLAKLRTIGPRQMLVNGGVDIATKPIWIEGPHIFRKDGWYYLSCAEGGTAEGHSQVILRSKSVTGPYVPGPRNPILTQRDLPRDRAMPITSAGHAQLVTTPAGDWWATFLAVRPYEGDHYNTGRETFLMPVEWVDGWPVITRPGQAIPYFADRKGLPAAPTPAVPASGPFTVRDEFDGAALPPYWMMMRNPQGNWFRLERGALVLDVRPVGLADFGNPSFLARRQQHMMASAETEVRLHPRKDGDSAGIAVLQNDEYWYYLAVTARGGGLQVSVLSRTGGKQPPGLALGAPRTLAIPAGEPVRLRIDSDGESYRFAYLDDHGQRNKPNWIGLGSLDARPLSTKSAGGFVGAVFGVFARSGE
ncbi:glycoside hydrolase family 43 protein [Sphingomonas canadensis]|uniref:Glycoside hydrolase family 43 protein n=1 Tax=Sphingomonas canadensis TaxID=1219257 RepID=A0ABW3H4P9_9SPHN|nr:glycoside hydrolase family 43 protein [Sphingomonas canadensis]MCW3835716.1 glycoside hydrolase family 43 protein [Sphingomonas canadensis]